jgi:hypothetical protein
MLAILGEASRIAMKGRSKSRFCDSERTPSARRLAYESSDVAITLFELGTSMTTCTSSLPSAGTQVTPGRDRARPGR